MGNASCCDDGAEPANAPDRRVRVGPVPLESEDKEVWGKLANNRADGNPEANQLCTISPSGPSKQNNGVFGRCCASIPADLEEGARVQEHEEIIDPLQIKKTAPPRTKLRSPASDSSLEFTDVTLNPSMQNDHSGCAKVAEAERFGQGQRQVRWERWRPLAMGVTMVLTIVLSSFADGWLSDSPASQGSSLASMLRYGSIPLIAAIIGYGTNVVALQMMFYPLEFMGCFPQLKIGCGLDLPLCGWQGVIPMKAVEMATISVDLMTQKLIKVEEIFSRLDPEQVAKEVAGVLPDVVSAVVNEAGRRHCPKLWEHLPIRVRKQLEERVTEESQPMMARFIDDLQRNISTVFDLKACVVDKMVEDRRILNDTFLKCGAEEFDFIRVSGFYLGFFFGLLQMVVWMFVKQWWILPLCGVFVGYFTNVVALKVIFLPVEPRKVLGSLVVQGLFLQRQREVSATYARQCAEKILAADVLMHALVAGPSADKMFQLVDKHVSACMEDQAGYYKPMFLLSIGSETWADFRGGVCQEFQKRLPLLLSKIQRYTQETLQLEETLRTRLEALPPREFERLLHAVFEQDEIKLILVGALLGALVGFLQALVQTPEQLGLG